MAKKWSIAALKPVIFTFQVSNFHNQGCKWFIIIIIIIIIIIPEWQGTQNSPDIS